MRTPRSRKAIISLLSMSALAAGCVEPAELPDDPAAPTTPDLGTAESAVVSTIRTPRTASPPVCTTASQANCVCASQPPLTSRTAPISNAGAGTLLEGTGPGMPVTIPAIAADASINHPGVPAVTCPSVPTQPTDTTAGVDPSSIPNCVASPTACTSVAAFGALGNDEFDDTAAINAAVNSLPASGGTLFLPAGRYYVNSGLSGSVAPTATSYGIQVVGKTKVKVVGVAGQTTIVDTYDHNEGAIENTYVGALHISGGSDVTVANLRMEYSVGYTCATPAAGMTDIGFSSGIYARNVVNLKVYNVEVRGFTRAGVYVSGAAPTPGAYGSTRPYVGFSLLQQNRQAGMTLGYATDALVESNRLHNNGKKGDGTTGYGVANHIVEPPRNTTVSCNLADFTIRKGIDMHSALTDPGKQTIVRYNKSVAAGLAGIYIGGYEGMFGGSIVVSRNYITRVRPSVTQGTHQVVPADIHYDIAGIWLYPKFRDDATTKPGLVVTTPNLAVVSNVIEDSTGTEPAKNGTASELSYQPVVIDTEAYSQGTARVALNSFNSRKQLSHVSRLIGSSAESGAGMAYTVERNSFWFSTNAPVIVGSLYAPLIGLSQATSATVVRNRLEQLPGNSAVPTWSDAAILQANCRQGDTVFSYSPLAAGTTCLATGNVGNIVAR